MGHLGGTGSLLLVPLLFLRLRTFRLVFLRSESRKHEISKARKGEGHVAHVIAWVFGCPIVLLLCGRYPLSHSRLGEKQSVVHARRTIDAPRVPGAFVGYPQRGLPCSARP